MNEEIFKPIEYDPKHRYMLFRTTDKDDDKPIRPISGEPARKLIESAIYLGRFRLYEMRLLEVQLNFLEYERASKSSYRIPTDLPIVTTALDEGDMQLLNTNRLGKNFVFSWRAYIELMEKELKNKFGNKSPEYNKWEKAKRLNYNTHFAYRFLYQLRNVGSHIQSMIDASQVSNGAVIPSFRKQDLIKTGEFKKPEFKNDWKQLNHWFPVMPIFRNGFELLRELHKVVLSCCEEKFVEHSKTVLKLVPETDGENITIGIINQEPLKIQSVGVKNAKNLLRYYDKLT